MEIQRRLEELDCLYGEGRLPEAEKKLEEWLSESREKGEQGAELTILNEMEGLYRTTGRAGLAVEVSGQALKLIEAMGLAGTIHHGTTLLNGATASRMAGDGAGALSMYQEAARIFRNLGQEKSYQMASLYNNISQLYQEQGKNEEAIESLKKALDIILPMEDSDAEVATTRVNMALCLMALGNLEEAAQEIGMSLAYYGSSAGERDGHYGSALCAAGELAWRRGDSERAAALLEKALEVTRERFGENDACRIIQKNLQVVRENMAVQ